MEIQTKWGQELDIILNKLAQKDPIGRNHIEQYLRDQYRRHCRPNTIQNSLITIEQFLFYIRGLGKNHLEEITRGDIGAFVEHEQDRGLKASTVHMRLRTLKAFLRYLFEKLPHAIDENDYKVLLPLNLDKADFSIHHRGS